MASRRAKPRQDAGDQRIREAAAEIYRVVRPVTLDEITVLDEVQVRVNGLDEQRVEQYVEFLLAGGSFKDPIDLFEDGERLILGAGWHRREAYKRALERFVPSADVLELASLKAEIHPGGLPAAIEWAEEDNLAHGLELSPRDKRNILARRLKRGHEWARLSNRALAAKLGVSRQTVANWRDELETESGGKNLPPERIGRDGKAYSVPGIQAANQQRAEEQREKGKIEQANDRMAAKLAELQGAVLAVVEGQPPMSYREIEFAVNAHLGRIANPGLLSGAISQLTQNGLLRNVGGGRYALAEPSDNRYQMEDELSGNSLQIDTGEPEGDWLDRQVSDEWPAVPPLPPLPNRDEDLAAKLSELLRVGNMVAGHLEMVLERPEPIPNWLLIKLNELQGLLYGRAGRDADIYDPGLTQLLDDLYTKHTREKGKGQ